MHQHLDPKTVAKVGGAISLKTPEKIDHIYFLGLMHVLRPKGCAVLIELKSSEKPEHREGCQEGTPTDCRQELMRMFRFF
jgi:hypothetical protein